MFLQQHCERPLPVCRSRRWKPRPREAEGAPIPASSGGALRPGLLAPVSLLLPGPCAGMRPHESACALLAISGPGDHPRARIPWFVTQVWGHCHLLPSGGLIVSTSSRFVHGELRRNVWHWVVPCRSFSLSKTTDINPGEITWSDISVAVQLRPRWASSGSQVLLLSGRTEAGGGLGLACDSAAAAAGRFLSCPTGLAEDMWLTARRVRVSTGSPRSPFLYPLRTLLAPWESCFLCQGLGLCLMADTRGWP